MRFGKNFDVNIPTLDLEIPELNYDKDIIVDVTISKLHLEFLHPNKYNNFKFITQLDVKVPSRVSPGNNELIIGYRKQQNKCNFNCIDFELYQPSLPKLIGNRKKLKIITKLKIGKLPKKIDLTFKGYVDLFIKLKLPF
jgi:hypothetical protein